MSDMILGVSHLVISTADLDRTVEQMRAFGYALHGTRDDVPNMPEKAAFLKGKMPATTSMRLMVSERSLPAIELIRENTKNTCICAKGAPGFEPSFEDAGDILTITVPTRRLDDAIMLWNKLNVKPDWGADGEATIHFKPNLAGPGLKLRYLVMHDTEDNPTWLDQEGMVCVSFFARNTETIQAHLVEDGYEVSTCFDLVPLDRSYRLCFVRNKTGEIYEFLTPQRTTSGKGSQGN